MREPFLGKISVSRQPLEVGELGCGVEEEVMLGTDLGRLTFQFYFCVD